MLIFDYEVTTGAMSQAVGRLAMPTFFDAHV
jgi:hypothetical protein